MNGKWDDRSYHLRYFKQVYGTQTNIDVNEGNRSRAKQLDESNTLHLTTIYEAAAKVQMIHSLRQCISARYFEITKRVSSCFGQKMASFEELQEKGKAYKRS